ncbi:MAG: hypothetical protein KA271_06030 [Propionivibrio sp.]|nr:hypothetical protein [Propionivibrio sp.]
MKSLITLSAGLMAAGAAAAYSDFSLTAPAEIPSYILSIPELNVPQMISAGIALILVVSFREYQAFIDHTEPKADKAEMMEAKPLSSGSAHQ